MFIPSVEDEEFSKKLPSGCKLTRWGSHGADIIAKNGGKAVGMQLFKDILGVSPKEMMAFGDAQNDMDMLAYAGIGVAMGNAEDEVKQVADFVTLSVDEDGILYALEKYGIL